jgi:hypothetical protein
MTPTQNLDIPSVGINLNSDPYSFENGDYSFMLNGCLDGIDGKAPFARMLPGNEKACNLPNGYIDINSVSFNEQKSCLFLINPTTGDCEIGFFNGSNYQTIINDRRLGFSLKHGIQAVSDLDFEGNEIVIWVQVNAPIRYLNLKKLPFINGIFDIDALNLFRKYDYPNCRVIEIGNDGRIPACSAYITFQYCDENSNGLTSWTTPIGPFPIYKDSISDNINVINGSPDREITNKSIKIAFSNLDLSFKFFNVGIIKSFAGIKEAFSVARLSTAQATYLYTGTGVEVPVPIKDIITPSVSYESAKTIARVNGSILIGNLKSYKDFNLQPYINNVQLQWQVYRETFIDSNASYANPLNCAYKVSYRRNEVYSLGVVIRWNDGSKSRVYPLINRRLNKTSAGLNISNAVDIYGTAIPGNNWDDYVYPINEDYFESGSVNLPRHKVYNTAYVVGDDTNGNLDGPGIYGEFGYWESQDTYPNNPAIWGPNAGQPIRHFLMPDVNIAPLLDYYTALTDNFSEAPRLLKLGIRFVNIDQIINSFPLEVKSRMQGWELVRGDRSNNKTVIASGNLYNMWFTNWKDSISDGTEDIRLYPNYPLNDLSQDKYIWKRNTLEDPTSVPTTFAAAKRLNDRYRKDIFTFVSPDVDFNRPPLLRSILNIHYESFGLSFGNAYFIKPYPRLKHNKQDDEYRDIMYQMVTVGQYRNVKKASAGNTRREIKEILYVPFNSQVSGGNSLQPIHNLMRDSTVVINLGKPIPDPSVPDKSRCAVSDSDFGCKIDFSSRIRLTSCHYASIVNRIPNQYGSVFDTKYVYTNMDSFNISNGKVVFGGDTFICRYTKKRQMVMYQNAQDYIEFGDGSRGVDLKNSATIDGTAYYYTSVDKWIADNSRSECEPNDKSTSLIKLIDIGLPVFFTESDTNIDLRLNGSNDTFYPNLNDGSTKVQKWSGIENIDRPEVFLTNPAYSEQNDLVSYLNPDPFFNPSSTFGTHYSTRTIFSLNNSPENRFNNLLVFKPLDYFDFRRDCGELIDIRDIGNSQILFRMENGLFVDRKYSGITGDDSLLRLGTGKLFESEPSLVSKSDGGYVGTCSQWAFNNTPFGNFMIDAKRGTAFLMNSEGPKDLNNDSIYAYGMNNFPIKFLEDFPDFKEYDSSYSPIGLGYNSIYDPENKLIFVTKKDFVLKNKKDRVEFIYNDAGELLFKGEKINFNDTSVFANNSWTFIYSLLRQRWIGWASFIPSNYLMIGRKFYSTGLNSLWEHNKGKSCSYYGKRYPFIFEGVQKFKGFDNSLNSFSFISRAFKNQSLNTVDETFNKCYIYNTRSCTGMMNLTIQNENNLPDLVRFEQAGSDFVEKFLRKRKQSWQLSPLEDLVKNRNIPFLLNDFDSIQSEYFIDQVLNNQNLSYDSFYFERPTLEDLWYKYRLIYDKDSDLKLFLYLSTSESEPVID